MAQSATVGAPPGSVEAEAARLFALDLDLIQDPFGLYKRMRAEAPVMRVSSVVAVSRYDDIKQVFRDPVTYSNIRSRGSRVTDRKAALKGEEREKYTYLIDHDLTHIGQQDGDNHTRLRNFVNDTFTSAAIASTRDAMTTLAHELLDEIESRGEDVFDFSAFTYRLPFVWMCRMLGVSDDEIDTFRSWALAVRTGLGTNYDNLEDAFVATKNVEKWVLDFIAKRRADTGPVGDDLVSKLVAKEVDGTHLTDEELVSMFTVMLTTGNVNDMISNAVIALDDEKNHSQRQLLLDDPSLFRGAVEEFFRYCPSVHSVHRVATKDCEIAGFAVHAGETVRLMVASANHDPEMFENPETLDITRPSARKHLDFGFGMHTCLGSWLSRLEIEVGLTCLYERYPRLSVAGDFSYRRNYAFHGPDVLMVDTGRS